MIPRERDLMYEALRDLTNKLSILISLQAQNYDVMKNLDNRRDQLANQQRQLDEILNKVSN